MQAETQKYTAELGVPITDFASTVACTQICTTEAPAHFSPHPFSFFLKASFKSTSKSSLSLKQQFFLWVGNKEKALLKAALPSYLKEQKVTTGNLLNRKQINDLGVKMGEWWEEEWHILSCLQELAWKALHFPGSFVKVFPLSVDAHSSKTPVELGLLSCKLWHMAFVLAFFFFFNVIMACSSKKRATGSCETQRGYSEFAATQKVIELKRNLKTRPALQGHSSEER